MTSMIEKIARAICAKQVAYAGIHDDRTFAKRMEEEWESWVPEARAAVEAMMEPDDHIRDAGRDAAIRVLDNHLYTGIPGVAVLAGTAAYKAMINAILNEGK